MQTTVPFDADRVFAALADATRRDIVLRAMAGDEGIVELSGHYPMSFAAVQKHIAVLERAGLVSRSRVGQTRPCRLETAALDGAVGWIEASTRAWTERFDRLDAHLRTLGER